MFGFIKKLLKPLDDASKRLRTTCEQCGHVMEGNPQTCEKCGMDLWSKFD